VILPHEASRLKRIPIHVLSRRKKVYTILLVAVQHGIQSVSNGNNRLG